MGRLLFSFLLEGMVDDEVAGYKKGAQCPRQERPDIRPHLEQATGRIAANSETEPDYILFLVMDEIHNTSPDH